MTTQTKTGIAYRFSDFFARRGWLVAKTVFALHFVLWLVVSYFLVTLFVNQDAGIYRDAAHAITQRQQIYWLDMPWPTENPYYYTPQFAWIVSFFNFVDDRAFVFIFGIVFQAIPLLLSFKAWQGLAADLKGDADTFNRWLPLMLVATSTIANFFFGNVIVLLAGLIGVGLYGLYRKQAWLSALTIVLTVLMKPQIAAPFFIVLIFYLASRDSRPFAWRAIAYSVLIFVVVTIGFLAAVGPDYGLKLMVDQVRFLGQVNSHYPYIGPDQFFTSNHSLDQQFFRVGLGNLDWIATLIKGLFGLHFLWLLWRAFRSNVRIASHPQTVAILALMSYLVTMTFAGQMQELLAGPIILALFVSFREPGFKWSKWLLVFFFLWEITFLIIPLPDILPLSLLELIILYWMGLQFVNRALKQPAPAVAPTG